jgi:hypothetical protein
MGAVGFILASLSLCRGKFMSMNSFSFRAEKLARSSETSSENSEGIDAFTSPDPEEMQNFLQLKNLNFEPVDLSKLQKGWKDPAGAGRRAAPRFKIQFTVLIANHQKAFRSVSENISATGILLKDILPIEFCDSTFDIVLVLLQQAFCARAGSIFNQSPEKPRKA